MDVGSVAGAHGRPAAPAGEAGRLQRAAGDFEALMISELLSAAHLNGSEGWLGEEDAAADSAFGLAQEHLAKSLVGSLGIAATAIEGLRRDEGERGGAGL
jgi:hypothetical protein